MNGFLRVSLAVLFRITLLGALWLGVTSLVGLVLGIPFLGTVALVIAGGATAIHTAKSLADTARKSRAFNEIEDHNNEQIEWSLLEDIEGSFFSALEYVSEKIGGIFHKKRNEENSVRTLDSTLIANHNSLPIIEGANEFGTSKSQGKNKDTEMGGDR